MHTWNNLKGLTPRHQEKNDKKLDFKFTFQITMSRTCQIYMSDVVAVSFYLKNNRIRAIISHIYNKFSILIIIT